MTAPAHPVPDGTRVKVTARSVSGDEDVDRSAGRAGSEYDVFSYAPEGVDNDDPNCKAYYLLDDEHSIGGSHWAYPEHVEVVMTPEQKVDRKLPSIKEVSLAVSGGLHRLMIEGMEFDETTVCGEYVEAYGRTDDGLRIGVRIAVLKVWETDF